MTEVVLKKIKLHPGAKDFLFENYAIVSHIFSNVLGQLEIDYISIALINERDEIFFLSSSPSIERNLIEKGLWENDYIYQGQFIYQNKHKLWSELYAHRAPELLKQYKQQNEKLIDGVSIPIDFAEYRAIFSFGFKKMNLLIRNESNKYEKLIAIGNYCLNRINKLVLFPDRKKCVKKPQLTLIVNKSGEL